MTSSHNVISDLQLDVKGCRDVYASFDKYVEVERLEGDNKYQAEEHGLQVSYLSIHVCNLHITNSIECVSLGKQFMFFLCLFVFRMLGRESYLLISRLFFNFN